MKTRVGPHRIGIVGAGNISRLHLDGIKRHPDRAVPVALCDPDKQSLTKRSGEYSVPDTYTDLGEMIEKAGIDAAIVCTPTHLRKVIVAPLVEAGIPVLCEKPFAETLSEAMEIEGIARRRGVPVAVNQNFRRHFTFFIARDVLESGSIGKPLHLIQTTCYLRRDRGWRIERKRYVMAVMSIHWFDGYRFLLQDEPETVYCRAVNSPATDGGEDTAVSVVLQFRKGTVVSLSESFSSFTRPSCATLDCESGGIIMEYEKMTEVRGSGERIERLNPYDKAEATYFVLEDLLWSIEEGREPETSAADNLGSMRVMEAAYQSMRQGRVVRIEEVV